MVEKETGLIEVYDEILNLVGRGSWTSIGALVKIIEKVPTRHAPRQEIQNIVRRCVKIVTGSKVAREQSSRGIYGTLLSDVGGLDSKLDDRKQSELKNDVLEEIRLAKAALNEYQEDISKQSVDYLRVRFQPISWLLRMILAK